MTTLLSASASLMIRVGVMLLTAFSIILLISAAAMADTIAVTPTGPAPVPDVPTVTLWRDGALAMLAVVVVALIVWRSTLIERYVRGQTEFHGLAAALMEDELIKRGVVQKAAAPAPAPEPTLDPVDEPWAAEADKIAAVPPPAPQIIKRGVTPSTKAVAQTFSARRARGEKVQ